MCTARPAFYAAWLITASKSLENVKMAKRSNLAIAATFLSLIARSTQRSVFNVFVTFCLLRKITAKDTEPRSKQASELRF